MSDTACKRCVFAQYDRDTQIGCVAGRIDLFKSKGYEVIDAIDDDKEFWVIRDSKCMMGRTEEWAPYVKDPNQDLISLARKEISIKCVAIVYVDESTTLEDVITTQNALTIQNLPPTQIVYLHKAGVTTLRPSIYRKVYENVELLIPYRTEVILDESLGRQQCIELVRGQLKKKTTHYVVFNAGFAPHTDFLYNLDYLINDQLEKIVAVLPDEQGNGLCMLKGLAYSKVEDDIETQDDTDMQEFTCPMTRINCQR